MIHRSREEIIYDMLDYLERNRSFPQYRSKTRIMMSSGYNPYLNVKHWDLLKEIGAVVVDTEHKGIRDQVEVYRITTKGTRLLLKILQVHEMLGVGDIDQIWNSKPSKISLESIA